MEIRNEQNHSSCVNNSNNQQGERARTRKGDTISSTGKVSTPQSSQAINGDSNPVGAENVYTAKRGEE